MVDSCLVRDGGGHGVYVERDDTSVASCTIEGNNGHSLFWNGAAGVPITGTILANSVTGNGLYCVSHAPSLSCCNLWGNGAGDYGGAIGDQTGINGNIREDPQFCSPIDGDYHLREGSPCVGGYGCGQMGAYGPGCAHCDGMEPWIALEASLPDSTRDMAAAVHRTHLYASGGLIAGGHWTDQVLYTRALGEYTGPWTATAALPDSVRDHRMLSVGDWIYAIGGSEGAVGTPENPIHREVHNDVWKAEPGAEGDISSWVTEASLPVPLWGAGAAVWDGRIYVAGGSERDSVFARPADRIYHAEVDPSDGSIQDWTECSTRLPVAATSLDLVADQGRLWAIGGMLGPPSHAASDAIYSTAILPDGTLSPSWVSAPPLPEPRHSFGSAVGPGDSLYVVGGYDASGYSRRSVFRAALHDDGSTGDWDVCDYGLPAVPGFEPGVGVSNMALVFDDCCLYSIGGYRWSAAANHGFSSQVLATQLLDCIPTGVPEGEYSDPDPDAPVTRYALLPISPNPFNPVAVIRYEIPPPGAKVSVRIYNLTGRVVRTLVDGESQAGRHELAWDGRSDDGRPAASGVYFCRLEAGGFTQARKLVLLK